MNGQDRHWRDHVPLERTPRMESVLESIITGAGMVIFMIGCFVLASNAHHIAIDLVKP